nr:hypothetical protein [Tanacetum cinerariifolium]
FDCSNLFALIHGSQRQARVNTLAVNQNRTSTALAVVAAFFGASHVHVFAQRVEQRGPGSNLDGVVFAVNIQRNGLCGHYGRRRFVQRLLDEVETHRAVE